MSTTPIIEDQLQDLETHWHRFVSSIDELAPNRKLNEIWFKKLTPIGFDGQTLTVLAPPRVFVEYLENTHGDLIQRAMDSSLGSGTLLKIVKEEEDEEDGQDDGEVQGFRIPAPQQQMDVHKTNLNPRYRFDNYIEGDSNRFAVASARSISEMPSATPFNPYFIYGGSGYGKTHLIQAIGNAVLRAGQLKRVVYVTSEQFVNQFIASIRTKRTTNFAHFYRNMDMLILDDIQFFQGKERTLSEFFHTFNSLHEAGKQIILSSDRPPRDLKALDSRLTSRFASGLVTELTLPDLETRVAILEKRAEESRIRLAPEIVDCLADNISTNVRDLEGALKQLVAQSQLLGAPITLEMTHQVLRKYAPTKRGKVSMETIAEVCADYYRIPLADLKDRGRKKEIAQTRQIAMYVCKELTRHSLRSIALHFGRRDHSTVIHAVKTIEDRLDADPVFQSELDDLVRAVQLAS